ncbi:MAG: hypothetical protein IKN12_12720 [Selenomonadaceae bacterium]|nr:hypothetical protein [Selenomonadaceae bacterium]
MKFLHSSDIMLPGYFGIHTIQFQVIMRYIDAKLYTGGGKPIWEILFLKLHGREVDAASEKCLQDDFIYFIDRMKQNGFHPELSKIELAEQPILWIFNGTHRVGYLFTQIPNFFIPVNFVPAAPWGITNGATYLRSIGLPEDMLNELLRAYNEIYSKMRRTITGVMDSKIFNENSAKIAEELGAFGKMFFLDAKNISLPKNNDMWRDKLSISGNNATVIFMNINRETLYIKDGEIYSYEVDGISNHFNELFGKNWGYISHTITESIMLEEYLNKTCVDKKNNE